MNGRDRNQAFQITLALCIALGLALILTVHFSFTQRKTIALLRASMSVATQNQTPESMVVSETKHEVIESPLTIAPNLFVSPETNRVPNDPVKDNSALREENERLATNARLLEAALTKANENMAQPEDPAAAYVGQGTWINVDSQTRGITRITIWEEPTPENSFSRLGVKVWARCHPRDCEWEPGRLFLLDSVDSTPAYRRGFAAWESLDGSHQYLIVTFEKSGLKVDSIWVPSERGVSPKRHLERMMRIN